MGTLHRGTRFLFTTVIGLGLLFIFGGTAFAHAAHAKVTSATPGIGSTIGATPTTVSVNTAENMKPGAQFSNLFVYGPSGALISQGDAKVDLNNPQKMSVAIKPEKDGMYVVRWITVSADDGDPDQGAFVFTVNSNAATTPAAKQTTTSSATTTSPGVPVWLSAVIGIVALLIGLGAGVILGNRRRTPALTPTGATDERESTASRRP